MILNIIKNIRNLFFGTESQTTDTPTGAEAVRTAINETEGMLTKTYTATLGEPRLADVGDTEMVNDVKILVPIKDAPGGGKSRLVFDLPLGKDGDDAFEQLLNTFGVDLQSLEDLDGKTVPVFHADGQQMIDWRAIATDSATAAAEEAASQAADSDEQSAVKEASEVVEAAATEAVEKSVEQAADAEQTGDSQTGDSQTGGSQTGDNGGESVTVEETTVTADTKSNSAETNTSGSDTPTSSDD